MSVNVYDFGDYSGKMILKGDTEKVERRVYLRGQCNCDLVILSRVIENDEPVFYLYNFIADKDHLKNMVRNEVDWFYNVERLELKIDKIYPFVKELINWAISGGVEVTMRKREE